MRITITLADAGGGARLPAIHGHLRMGLSTPTTRMAGAGRQRISRRSSRTAPVRAEAGGSVRAETSRR